MPYSLPKCLILAARRTAADARKILHDNNSAEEKLHDMRVTLKQLRSLGRVLTHGSEPRSLREALVKLRDIGRRLSVRRDQDVLDKLFKHYANKVVPTLKFAMADTTQPAIQSRSLVKAECLIRIAAKRVQSWGNKVDDKEVIVAKLHRLRRRVRKRYRQVVQNSSPEAFHFWRKSVKTLYCLMDFHLMQIPARHKIKKALDELGEKLGDLHDIYNLESRLESGEMGRFLGKIRSGKILRMVRQDSAKLAKRSLSLGKKISHHLA